MGYKNAFTLKSKTLKDTSMYTGTPDHNGWHMEGVSRQMAFYQTDLKKYPLYW